MLFLRAGRHRSGTAPLPEPGEPINWALASNGGVAKASTTYNGSFPASAGIDGDLYGATTFWNDQTLNTSPDWYMVQLGTYATINRIVLFTPVPGYVSAFQVQVWDGEDWVTVGSVTGNNQLSREVAFPPVATTHVRIYITAVDLSYARITELQVWGVPAAGEAPPGPDYQPYTLNFEEATPEQIGIYAPLDGSVGSTATMTVEYKQQGSSTWRLGHPLHRITPGWEHNEHTYPVVDAFAGSIFDLTPGAAYDVRLTLSEPGFADRVQETTRATRPLPPAAPAVTHTASPGDNLQTKFNALVPGNHLKLADGIYTVSDLYAQFGVGGSRADTTAGIVYVSGTSRTGTIIKDTSGRVIQFRELHNVVFENLRLEGSSVNSNLDSSSTAFGIWDGANSSYVTVRNCDVVGCDVVMRGSDQDVRGYLVYNNRCTGNNVWGAPDLNTNNSWNDDGITISGFGNCAFHNTMHGFGDSFAVLDGPDGSAGVYFYRNKITMTGDDVVEADYGTRNIAYYDNWSANSATFLSLDPILGGPFYAFRNIGINPFRGPQKINNTNTGFFIYNNTVIKTEGITIAGKKWGWIQFNNGALRGWGYRNNVFIHQNPGALSATGGAMLLIENAVAGPVDFDHNAWYPDFRFRWQDGGYHETLALAKIGIGTSVPVFSGLQRHVGDVITTSSPFVTAVTLGATYETEYTGDVVPVLANGSSPKNAGVAIPGITDGYSGAAPDMGAIISGRAIPVYGYNEALDPEVPTAMPAWAVGQQQWEWREIPNSSMQGVNPTVIPAGVNGPAGRIDAWQALAVDKAGGKAYVAAAGGHDDYSGNEVVKIDLWQDTPGWQIIRQPTPAAQVSANVSHYADGRPTASHHYYALHHCPYDNSLRINGISVSYGTGSHGAAIGYRYDLNPGVNDWDGAGTSPNVSWGANGGEGKGGQVTHPLTGDIYYIAYGGTVKRWVAATGAFETRAGLSGPGADASYYRGAAIDTSRNQVLWVGNAYDTTDGGILHDIAGNTTTAVNFTGPGVSAMCGNDPRTGAVYDPSIDRYVVKTWFDTQIVLITPGTWATEVQGTSGATFTVRAGAMGDPNVTAGIFGLFRELDMPDGSHGAVFYPRHNGPMYFLKTSA